MEQENHPLDGDLELKAREARVYVIAGEGYLKERWYSQADSCFYNALLLQPDNLYANLGIGQIHLESRAYAKAAERFQKALDLNPEHTRAQKCYTLAMELNAESKDDHTSSIRRIYEADVSEKTVN